ncbi:hypothetical protein D3C72_1219630 [compost metagenome]
MQTFNTVFACGTTKQRQRWETGIAPLTIGDFHHHRFFKLIHAEDAVIKGLRIAFDQVEIFRTLFQAFKLVGNQGQIRHNDGVSGWAIKC